MSRVCMKCNKELPKHRGWRFAKLCTGCWAELLVVYMSGGYTLSTLAGTWGVSVSAIEQKLTYIRKAQLLCL